MLIVYRKTDGEILFNSGKSFIRPEGMSDINGKLAVIQEIGGSFNDYGTYRLHDIEEKEKVDKILKYEGYVELIIKSDVVIDYRIDYKKYKQEKLALEEQQLLDSLRPNIKDILLAEMELKVFDLLEEADLNIVTMKDRLINAYTVLVAANQMDLAEVPDMPIILSDKKESTIRKEVEIKKAEREIEILTPAAN